MTSSKITWIWTEPCQATNEFLPLPPVGVGLNDSGYSMAVHDCLDQALGEGRSVAL